MDKAFREMEVTTAIITSSDEIVVSEESASKMVAHGALDMATAGELLSSTEAIIDGASTFKSGIKLPSKDEAVIVQTALKLATKDEQEAFNSCVAKLNNTFAAIYNRTKGEINHDISKIIEIEGKDVSKAASLMKVVETKTVSIIK